MFQYATLDDTVYFWFAANDTAGSGADGETPLFDVRLAGAAADAAPVLSGSPTLLTHVNYPAGAHEIAIAATTANGFATGSTYAVFCTLLVDSQNPTGFVGAFKLGQVPANAKQLAGQTVNAAGAVTFNANVGAAAAPGSANGMLIAGSNSATTFAALTCTGALTISDGVIVTCSTLNRSALSLTGNGTGYGLIATGGGNASGIYVIGGANGAYGFEIVGSGAQALQLTGGAGSEGLRVTAGAGGTYSLTVGTVSIGGIAVTFPESVGTSTLDSTQAQAAAAAAITAAGVYTGMPPTADAIGTDAASKILATPANKLATNASGEVTPTAASKTDYSLAATGLDAIADPDDLTPATVPTTFTQKLRWLIQRFWKAEKTATAIIVKNEAGQTITTQAIAPSGSDQTTGAPS